MLSRGAVAALTGCAFVLAACGPNGSPTTQPSSSGRASSATSPAPTPSSPVPSGTGSSLPSARPTPTRPPRSSPATTSPQSALPAWLDGVPVTRLPTSRRVVALTFDGGSGAQGATSILHTLHETGVRATFFLTGDFVRTHPGTAAAIASGHYLLGNHTMTHPHLTQLTSAAVIDQVHGAEQQLTSVAGRTPRPWFRFPFGEYDSRTLNLLHGIGYGAIGWTVDTRGWQGREAGTAADVERRVRSALQPGAIVLMHLGGNPDDGTTFDADALPQVIATVRAAGYSFVVLNDW